MASLRKNVAGQNITFALVNATTGAALVGATVTGVRSIDGAAQVAVGGSFTSLGGGQYLFAPSQADTNGTAIGYLFTATSAIPVNMHFFTDNWDTTQAVLTSGTGANQIQVDGSGNVFITSNVKKNAAGRITFVMTDSTTHLPKTGLTVTSQRSIDGAALVATANSVTEISNGLYTLVLAAADTNGNDIDYRLTSAGADDLNIEFVTQP